MRSRTSDLTDALAKTLKEQGGLLTPVVILIAVLSLFWAAYWMLGAGSRVGGSSGDIAVCQASGVETY